MKHNMKRINFMLPPRMLDALAKESAATGLPVSEHIRRAILEYLRSNTDEQLGRNKD